jgi:putative transposase
VKQFTEEQIIGILKEAEAGAVVTELCRNRRLFDVIGFVDDRGRSRWAGAKGRARHCGPTVGEDAAAYLNPCRKPH